MNISSASISREGAKARGGRAPHFNRIVPAQVSGMLAGLFAVANSFAASTAMQNAPDGNLVLSPVHPEIPPTFWEQYGWWVALGSLVLIALVGLLVLLKLLRNPPPIIPIEMQTRQEFDALSREPEDGRTLSSISRCLRRYVIIAFGLPAQEMTTAELAERISASSAIGPQLAESLNRFFRHCDGLKFSPAQPASSGTAQRALELFEAGERRRAELRVNASAKPPA